MYKDTSINFAYPNISNSLVLLLFYSRLLLLVLFSTTVSLLSFFSFLFFSFAGALADNN